MYTLQTDVTLIEASVPVAIDKAREFADCRETATKTNSLVNRFRTLTVPAVEDVREGLESYIETKTRAEELEVKIKRTDDLIDEIVRAVWVTDKETGSVADAVSE